MNIETSSNAPFPTSSAMGSGTDSTSGLGASGSSGFGSSATGSSGSASSGMSSGMDSEGRVHRMALKAHETVDKLEQKLDSGGQRVLSFQQEYGDMAREQVRTNPLASVGIAFGVGILFAKIIMR